MSKELTKEEFLVAYNKHQPNKFTKFIYNKRSILVTIVASCFFTFNVLCVILIEQKSPVIYQHLSIILGNGLLPIYAILTFIAFEMNNYNVRKTINELGISDEEYTWYLDQFNLL
jgi:hypothetical protein